MIYLILIFSFLLEGSFTNLITKNSLFVPLFFLTSLTLLYPYFKNKKLNFIISCAICGLLYDIIFSNSIFVNTISYLVCGMVIIIGYNYLNYSILSSNFLNLIVIITYRIVSYMLLCLISFISFNEMRLLEGIYSSILCNIIYGVILFVIIIFISKKFNIKRAE